VEDEGGLKGAAQPERQEEDGSFANEGFQVFLRDLGGCEASFSLALEKIGLVIRFLFSYNRICSGISAALGCECTPSAGKILFLP